MLHDMRDKLYKFSIFLASVLAGPERRAEGWGFIFGTILSAVNTIEFISRQGFPEFLLPPM